MNRKLRLKTEDWTLFSSHHQRRLRSYFKLSRCIVFFLGYALLNFLCLQFSATNRDQTFHLWDAGRIKSYVCIKTFFAKLTRFTSLIESSIRAPNNSNLLLTGRIHFPEAIEHLIDTLNSCELPVIPLYGYLCYLVTTVPLQRTIVLIRSHE